MKTINKFWKYFLNFIVLFLLVTGLTYCGTKINDKNMEEKEKQIVCVAQDKSPKIEITKYNNKKIIGYVTNDMNVLMKNLYIKVDLYDKNEKLLETKYHEIKYFNVGEKSKFEIEYKIDDVAKIEVSATSSK